MADDDWDEAMQHELIDIDAVRVVVPHIVGDFGTNGTIVSCSCGWSFSGTFWDRVGAMWDHYLEMGMLQQVPGFGSDEDDRYDGSDE